MARKEIGDLFDEIDEFDLTDVDTVDEVIYSDEMRKVIQDEIRKEIAKLPIGSLVSSALQKESLNNKNDRDLEKMRVKYDIEKSNKLISERIDKIKEDSDEKLSKIKKHFSDLRNQLSNQPKMAFGGFPLKNPTAFGAARGAFVVSDGTSDTYLIGVQTSDTPTNGQVPTFNTNGTITWETGGGMSIGGTVTGGTADSVLFVGSGPVLAQSTSLQFNPLSDFLKISNSSSQTVIGDIGGNSRGTNALELQASRGVATQVASGSYSTAIGISNTASNSLSIAIGNSNNVSGPDAFGIGQLNTVSGITAGAFGYNNTVSTTNSWAFGAAITNSTANSVAIGPSDSAKLQILTTGAVVTSGNVELGHATDTTLSRVTAGVVAIEGVNIATISGTQTLTNKRVNPRTSTAASGDISADLATANIYQRTAIAATIAINAPIGTPVLGEVLVFMLLDDGTSRTLNWNAAFTTRVMTAALPTATTVNKQLLVTCQYNGTTWLCLSSTQT